jgi:hypothetical protein|tara:strand:- start:781 stop:1200 length:420 start_codon:yes stop_codon:yes gene_type:complete
MHKLLVIALNLFRNFFLLDLVLVERFDIIIELLTHETILFQNLDVVDNLLLDASDSPELVSFIVFAVQEFLTVWNCTRLFHHYLLLAQDNFEFSVDDFLKRFLCLILLLLFIHIDFVLILDLLSGPVLPVFEVSFIEIQ